MERGLLPMHPHSQSDFKAALSDLSMDDFNGEAATKQRGQIFGCFIFSPC